ncbi:MAG TPA: hypothetical protein VFR14_13580 [Candidatus Limnocylindrales bacterium]|nr:hypothetical protein [Candidatus Limnocylindrales bacterium]
MVVVIAALAAPVAASSQVSRLFGGNLIVNGGAEAGPASDGFSSVPIPGWTVDGPLTVVAYDTPDPDGLPPFPTSSGPGPEDRGANFFAGGPANASSSASQAISIAAAASLIDTGAVRYDLSGYLGGWTDQEDNAVVRIVFKQGTNALGSAEIGPVGAADRGNETGLLGRATSGLVPVGTRQIVVSLVMTKQEGVGAYNDGYADNLSLVLSR